MQIPTLWSTYDLTSDPIKAFRAEMDDLMKRFGMAIPALDIGAKSPAVDISESQNSIEVTAELPGVQDKDITIKVEGNRLIISGKKNQECRLDNRVWHIEERSYGQFYKSMTLPFVPDDGAIKAQLERGVLYVSIKKPAEAIKNSEVIPIKSTNV